MARYAFDIETNGLLDDLDTIHSLVLQDLDSGLKWSCTDHRGGHTQPIRYGLEKLQDAEEIVGHNIIKFDIPAIQKVFPWFTPKGRVIDTLIRSRYLTPDLIDRDSKAAKRGSFPGHLIGSHSLEAWGYRLGLMKGEYSADFKARLGTAYQKGMEWESWSQDMQDYCEQDVDVTVALHERQTRMTIPLMADRIEHEFATIISLMERRGFAFNEMKARFLYAELVKIRLEVKEQLVAAFPPKEVVTIFVPKVNNKKMGYVKGEPFEKRKLVEFNPSSRQMIADRLVEKGWKPLEFTPTGQPKIDESILSKLPYPEAKVLARYFLIEKRIGQLAEGDQAWLRLVRKGRIHGSVNTNGAITGRCTHSNPNVAQVPKVKFGKVDGVKGPLKGEAGVWGFECRDLFTTTPGWVLVGADLAGIELRCLGHYMARYDGGAYAKAVVEGSSDDETDVHSLNAKALGFEPKGSYTIWGKVLTGRDIAKTFIYAFLYGAGDEKLGSIVGVSEEEIEHFKKTQGRAWAQAVKALERQDRARDPITIGMILKGKQLKTRFLEQTPALARLREDVGLRAKQAGKLRALDGRILPVRSQHAALNTLLQNAGALVAKEATICAWKNLSTRGYVFGKHWALVAHVHDELQVESKKEIADEVGKIIVESMEQAGEILGFRVPVSGEYMLGQSWADTH